MVPFLLNEEQVQLFNFYFDSSIREGMSSRDALYGLESSFKTDLRSKAYEFANSLATSGYEVAITASSSAYKVWVRISSGVYPQQAVHSEELSSAA